MEKEKRIYCRICRICKKTEKCIFCKTIYFKKNKKICKVIQERRKSLASFILNLTLVGIIPNRPFAKLILTLLTNIGNLIDMQVYQIKVFLNSWISWKNKK